MLELFVLLPLLQLQAPPRPAAAHKIPPPAPRWNILLVVADDVGVDLLSSYAIDYPPFDLRPCTPHLDELAAQGVRFTNAWSSPVCSPSRAQILTGKPSRWLGTGHITHPTLPDQPGLGIWEDTLPKVLGGYHSAALGKWHLASPPQLVGGFTHPLNLGFASWAGSLYSIETPYDLWTKTVVPPGDQFPDYMVYATTDTTQDALALLPTLPEPWFVQVAYNAPHFPFHCPGDHGHDCNDPAQAACGPSFCIDCSALLGTPMCQTFGKKGCQVRAMTMALDTRLGELFAAVDYGDTLVVFTSDNGTAREAVVPPFNPAHGKGMVYQGGVNVPMIVRAPGGATGVQHALVSLTDLFDTFADVAGVTPPSDAHRDSHSLCLYLGSLQCDGPSSPRQYQTSELFIPNFEPDSLGNPPLGYVAEYHERAIRNGTHKLITRTIWSHGQDALVEETEFYQLADFPGQHPAFGPDPFEENDLMGSIGSWTPEDSMAFWDLIVQIDQRLPLLPVGP